MRMCDVILWSQLLTIRFYSCSGVRGSGSALLIPLEAAAAWPSPHETGRTLILTGGKRCVSSKTLTRLIRRVSVFV